MKMLNHFTRPKEGSFQAICHKIKEFWHNVKEILLGTKLIFVLGLVKYVPATGWTTDGQNFHL